MKPIKSWPVRLDFLFMSDYWSFIFFILTCSPAKMLGIFKYFEGLELCDEYAYAYACNPGPSLQPLSAFLQKINPEDLDPVSRILSH